MSLPGLIGQIDLARPERGLHEVAVHSTSLLGAQCLGLGRQEDSPGIAWELVDARVRQRDLVAVYRDSGARRAEAVWQAVPPDDPELGWGGLCLVLSVSTDRLEDCPQIWVGSRFSGTAFSATVLGPSADGYCTVRLEKPPLDYVEMVHPTAVNQNEVTAGPGDALQLGHRLFPASLERGVVVQALVTGQFLWRGGAEKAAELYAQFAASCPSRSA